MTSSKFSRRPRVQPPPKVCKSKEPLPTLPPCTTCTGPQPDVMCEVLPGATGSYVHLYNGPFRYHGFGRNEEENYCFWQWDSTVPGPLVTIAIYNVRGSWDFPYQQGVNLACRGDGILHGPPALWTPANHPPYWSNLRVKVTFPT